MVAAPPERADPAANAGPRRILGLAVPTLGVLVAEPIYLLFDLAVVGRLGALALAGLAVGGLILAQASSQLTFLSYGTTARAARRHGAGDERGAVAEGVQATWIAVVLGALIVIAVQLFATPLTNVIAGGGDIAAEALLWVRIALFGVPLILISMAGNGWLRGVQQTRRPLLFVVAGLSVSGVLCPVLVHGLLGAPRLELPGSAVANVAGQAVTAVLFLSALVHERISLAPHWSVMRAQLVLGRDLIVRSLAFQACFVSAAAVAARFGAASVAAHQLVLQLWNFLALTLDSLAIAAQTLVGAALGAGDSRGARSLARRITRWSELFALILAAFFAAGVVVIPKLFTDDPAVLDRTRRVVVLRRHHPGRRHRLRARRRPARRGRRGLPEDHHPRRSAARLPPRDLAIACLRLGSCRDLVRPCRIHAAEVDRRGLAGRVGPMGAGRHGNSRTGPRSRLSLEDSPVSSSALRGVLSRAQCARRGTRLSLPQLGYRTAGFQRGPLAVDALSE